MVDFYELGDFIAKNIFMEKTILDGIEIPLVFLVEKPKDILNAESYIVYSFREIDGGKTLRHYEVEISINCKNIKDIFQIRQNIINDLDFYNRPCSLGYQKMILANEGGIYLDEISGYHRDKFFFDVKRK